MIMVVGELSLAIISGGGAISCTKDSAPEFIHGGIAACGVYEGQGYISMYTGHAGLNANGQPYAYYVVL